MTDLTKFLCENGVNKACKTVILSIFNSTVIVSLFLKVLSIFS